MFISGFIVFVYGLYLLGNGSIQEKEEIPGNRKDRGGVWVVALFTALCQSSSAVIFVLLRQYREGRCSRRFVMEGIMGANLGTTVTAWLYCMLRSAEKQPRLSAVIWLLPMIGMLLCLCRKEKTAGIFLLGLGMVLLGLEQMSASAAGSEVISGFLKNIFAVRGFWIRGIPIGMLASILLQSSSVGICLLQMVSLSVPVSFYMGVSIIAGQNIGSSLCTLAMTAGFSEKEKTAAVFHVLFNLITAMVLILILLMTEILGLGQIYADPYILALMHTGYNALGILIFYPQLRRMAE